ncbi:tetratricopeptide repeat protein [Nonomuraea sp. ATR24]|uniref:tetratricopeptide repeat protein n=1 Tax=Nonomuraea sp. ATR24 TaxID=1676744 RepID=UPI0035C06091
MTSERLVPAMRSWEAGDLDQAAVLFREIAATGDPEASHLLASLLEEAGDLDGAEAAHRSVIQSGDPVFGQRSAMAMGLMLVAAREWPAAHRVLGIAADGADFEVAALAETALVLVCTELGDLAGAEAALERARRCDSPAVVELAGRLELPDFTPAGTATPAELYEAAEDEDDYRRLLTCGDPETVSRTAFRLYQHYADEEDFEAAREVCEHAIAAGSAAHLATAYKLLGAVLVDLGEYAESVAAYARAAEDPRPGIRLPALLEQAKVIAQLGDEDATKAIFHRVIASGQREYAVEAHACLAQMHTEAGEVTEALTHLRPVLDAGESRWSSVGVTLLSMLLDAHPGAYEDLMELVRAAAGHPDPDTAYKAGLLLDLDARRQPLPDPAEEQALQDADAGLARLQAGDLPEARRLLRRAADAGGPEQPVRAMVMLAELELGEGDREQADELLSYVAEGEHVMQGFSATFLLHLLRASGDRLHPVLEAIVDHQRLGREEGLLRYRAAARHPDPAVAAIGTAVLAQVLASIGYDLSEAAGLFREAAGGGDPFALSYTAAVFKEILLAHDRHDEAADLLRRARADGHPALAPWVAYALGGLAGDDLAEARAAFTEALETRHAGLRREAATRLAQVLERQGDLLAACRLYERVPGARNAALLGLTRLRLDDLDGARAAFAQLPAPSADADAGELGRFGRNLLERDFAAAERAMTALPSEGGLWMATLLAMQAAHAWQRTGDPAAAGAALSLVLTAGQEESRQEAALYLAALRDDAGDTRGAIAAWELAATGDDPALAATALRAAGHALLTHPTPTTPTPTGGTPEEEAATPSGEAAPLGGPVATGGTAQGPLVSGLPAVGTPAEEAAVPSREAGPFGERQGWEEAVGAFERALEVEPGDQRAVLGLGEALVAAGRTERAGEVLAEAFGSGAPLHLAAFLRAYGHRDEAVAVAGELAVREPGEAPVAEGARLLGEMLAEAGETAGAREAFERAVAADPEGAGATLVCAGVSLERAGDAEGARMAFEGAARDADPWAARAGRARLGTASAEELPWGLLALGDEEGALAALAGTAGSREAAELTLALHREDVATVRRLLTARPSQEAFAGTLRAAAERGEAAEELYRLVVELAEPAVAAEARVGLGRLLSDDGRHCRAELCLLPATREAATAGAAWRAVGIARRRRGDLTGAVEAVREAMPDAAVQLAELLEELGDADGARAALGEGAAAGDLESLRHLLVHLLERGEYDAIPAQAERAVATGDPQTVAMGHWVWGDACRSTGDLAGAVKLYRLAMEAGDPDVVPGVRGDLAQALRARGDGGAAAEQAWLAIETGDPETAARAGVNLGCWLHEDGDPLGAADAFAAALQASEQPGEPQGAAGTALGNLAVLARQAAGRGEHQLAAQVLSRMGRHAGETARELGAACDDPAAVRGYFELAGHGPVTELEIAGRLAELGRTAEARAVYERLGGDEDPDVRFVAGGRLLELLEEQGDEDAFYSLAERQAGDAESPARAMFGSLLGMLQERQGDTEASLRTLRAAAESGAPPALTALAQALAGDGQVAEARRVYERVVAGEDAELAVRAMVAIGHTYHDDDPGLAREWYVRAVESGAGHASALGAMYLGALAKRERDFPEALGWYQRVIDAGDPESGMAAAHLGELCYWLGDLDGALRYYELTLGLTDRPELVAEAACRAGEIRYRHGDLAAAGVLLARAVETGDETFAGEAEALLGKLAVN